jgi:hypothetical protein
MINPRVGANEAEFVFHDDRTDARPQDFVAFLKDQFNDARIFLCLLGKLDGALRRCDRCKIYRPPFGLGNYFLRENKDIVVLKCNFIFPQRIKNNIRQVVAVADEGDAEEGGEGERHGKAGKW